MEWTRKKCQKREVLQFMKLIMAYNPYLCVMRFVLMIFMLVLSQLSVAQQLVKYDQYFDLREGIYLTFKDLQNNQPIPKSAIDTRFDINSQDFYYDLLGEASFKIKLKNDSIAEVKTEGVWGFCRNGNVYVNFSDEFYRIPVLGGISHFVATVEVLETGYYDPWYGMPSQQTRNELRQFMLDFDTGKVYDYTLENFLMLLQKDDQLYREFSNLKKRLQRQRMFLFLRRYNEAHPIYFPVG